MRCNNLAHDILKYEEKAHGNWNQRIMAKDTLVHCCQASSSLFSTLPPL